MTNAAQRTFFIIGVYTVGCILYDQQVMLLSQCHDGIHITSYSRIMNDHNHSCLVVDERPDSLYGYVGIVCPAVSKHDFGTFPEKGNGC